MSSTPGLPTIFERFFGKRAGDVRVALPGRVESYDSASQRASVQPLVMEERFDDQGERVAELPAIVQDVPIMFPGSGPYRVTWPVSPGDVVLLVVASSSIDRWKQRGGEVDPEDARHHDLSDAVAVPGLFDFAHVPTDAPTDALVVHGSMIKLGSPGSSTPPALATELADLKTRIAAWVPVVGDGGASLKAVFTAWPVPGATQVRVS